MFLAVTVLLGLATIGFISSPWWRPGPAIVADERPDQRAQRQEALLLELKELEFDHRMGKIDEAEYADLRAVTAGAASSLLNQGTASQNRDRLGLEAEAEILVARHRLRGRNSVSGWKCSKCGRTMTSSDSFCASCGSSRGSSASAGS